MWKIQIVFSTLWNISQSTSHTIDTTSISSTKFFELFFCGSFVWKLSAIHNVYEIFLAHCGILVILLQVLWKTLNQSFCIAESLHCNFHNVKSSNCTFTLWKISQGVFHIVETISISSKKKYLNFLNCDNPHC